MKIINLKGKTMGGTSKRISNVRKIAIHHSATVIGNNDIFANYWRTLGWNTGGYHEIILRNGDVELCYADDVITNGIKGNNAQTFHICMVGNGSFTKEQETSLEKRVKEAMKRFNLKQSDVLGHNEFANTATNCPMYNVSNFRNKLNNIMTTKPPTTSNNMYNGVSIIDYLKSIKVDSSFANRKVLATKYGIKNYIGSTGQNLQLLRSMRGF